LKKLREHGYDAPLINDREEFLKMMRKRKVK